MFIEFSKHAETGWTIYGNFSKEIAVTIQGNNGNVETSNYWVYNVWGESQEEIARKIKSDIFYLKRIITNKEK